MELIVYKEKLFALKKIPKMSLDQSKKIQHLLNEKTTLEKLKLIDEEYKKGVFSEVVIDGILNNSVSMAECDHPGDTTTKETSNRPSYLTNEESNRAGSCIYSTNLQKEKPPMPLNYIVSLETTFVDQEHINLVFEYLPGHDLYWVIKKILGPKLQKDEKKRAVSFYSSQILCALDTLRSYNIIYRDLKPENAMIDLEGSIKLIDFGFAKQLSSQNNFRTTTNCGTVGYTAPEVLLGGSNGYSFQADIWSYGILICEMIQQ